MDNSSLFLRFGYIALAAASGAFTALGFLKWKEMTRTDIAITVIGGFSFAVFVTPWIAHEWLGMAEDNTRALAALTYVMGSGSNVLLPTIIRGVKRLLGSEDAS